MCRMLPRSRRYRIWYVWVPLLIGCLAAFLAFLSGGCTVRVEGFHRPEAELRTIVREECVRAVLAYQEYLERERETDGARPMKPVS